MYCNETRPTRIPSRRRRGFSLVEIMVVLVIMGLLAGLVAVNVRAYLIKAKQKTALSDIATIVNALEFFYTEAGRYPTQEEGLAILTQSSKIFPEPPLKTNLVDPWGKSYQYVYLGPNQMEVLSYGEDKQEGGTGAAADISSRDLEKTEEP